MTDKKPIRALVIGDPHLKASETADGSRYLKAILRIATDTKPSMIVLLGDILDTHNVVRNSAFRMATQLIDTLRKIAPTVVLIGNHDLVNNKQFQTEKHFSVSHYQIGL